VETVGGAARPPAIFLLWPGPPIPGILGGVGHGPGDYEHRRGRFNLLPLPALNRVSAVSADGRNPVTTLWSHHDHERHAEVTQIRCKSRICGSTPRARSSFGSSSARWPWYSMEGVAQKKPFGATSLSTRSGPGSRRRTATTDPGPRSAVCHGPPSARPDLVGRGSRLSIAAKGPHTGPSPSMHLSRAQIHALTISP
jgi:hypothetical protein